jgi:hypothetical protein
MRTGGLVAKTIAKAKCAASAKKKKNYVDGCTETVSEYQPPVKQSRIVGATKFRSADGLCNRRVFPRSPSYEGTDGAATYWELNPRAVAPCPLEPREEGMRILARSKKESGKARAKTARQWVAGKKSASRAVRRSRKRKEKATN